MTPKRQQKSRQTSAGKSLPDEIDPNIIETPGDLSNQIDQKENQTNKNSGLKNEAKSQTTIKWSVVTAIETKSLVAKAAKKDQKKLFEWCDEKLREAATGSLTTKSQPPAKPEDLVKDIIEQFADKFRVVQEATTNAQNEVIEKQGRQIAELTRAIQNQPRNLKEMVFGKKNQID